MLIILAMINAVIQSAAIEYNREKQSTYKHILFTISNIPPNPFVTRTHVHTDYQIGET